MTACFKLMKALQPNPKQKDPLCESCVYFGRNLDQSYSLSNGISQQSCGLDLIPGNETCTEIRTDNCSTRKK